MRWVDSLNGLIGVLCLVKRLEEIDNNEIPVSRINKESILNFSLSNSITGKYLDNKTIDKTEINK